MRKMSLLSCSDARLFKHFILWCFQLLDVDKWLTQELWKSSWKACTWKALVGSLWKFKCDWTCFHVGSRGLMMMMMYNIDVNLHDDDDRTHLYEHSRYNVIYINFARHAKLFGDNFSRKNGMTQQHHKSRLRFDHFRFLVYDKWFEMKINFEWV